MTHTYTINGGIVPKARPRGTSSGRHYLPENYRQWKQSAIWELQRQHQGDPIAGPLAVEIVLDGHHNRRGDPDNVAGSILDALVQAGILADDNLTQIPSLTLTLYHHPGDPTTLIRIKRWAYCDNN